MSLETLLKSKGLASEERWYPVRLANVEQLLKFGHLSHMDNEIRKNIGYSLQYLQFLSIQIDELVMSSVIEKMVYKNYIITAVSVIEALLEQIVVQKGLQTTDQWELVEEFLSNGVGSKGELKRKVVTQIYKELNEPKLVQMKFDDIIKKIKNKNKKKELLDLEFDELLALDRFRKLRNKVHLTNFDEGKTNWHEFSKKEYVTVNFLLHGILTDPNLDNSQYLQCIEFLKLNNPEKDIINNFKKK